MVKRPILRYHGGKWVLAQKILSYFPHHKIYTESFGGAASLLLSKKRSKVEIYNDLDNEIVNLFQIVRDRGDELINKLYLTPFSRYEFELSYHQVDDPLEKARRTVVRSFMGFASASVTNTNWLKVDNSFKGNGTTPKTGFRNNNRDGACPSRDFKNYPEALKSIIQRLRGVVIENKDAKKVILQHDTPKTFHYLDPPYVMNTRYQDAKGNSYNFEMNDEEHEDLCYFLKELKGKVLISGYDNPIYNNILNNWNKKYIDSYADGARKRQEVLWFNYEERFEQLSLINNF